MTARILHGDCRVLLDDLDEGSVQTCVTSPPYWRCRDYDHASQVGIEESALAYVSELTAIFRSVRRVLHSEGTLWVNLGDRYTGSWAGVDRWHTRSARRPPQSGTQDVRGLRPKNMMGLPWRLAFALQDDGWILRSEIIWDKRRPNPNPVRDRPVTGHEHLFLLAKQRHYYYDGDAIAEPAGPDWAKRSGNTTRSARTIWSVSTAGHKGPHGAVMPVELARRCVVAGCPPGGVVLDPFGGTGTTAVAAAREGRSSIVMELNTDYINEIKRRLRAT